MSKLRGNHVCFLIFQWSLCYCVDQFVYFCPFSSWSSDLYIHTPRSFNSLYIYCAHFILSWKWTFPSFFHVMTPWIAAWNRINVKSIWILASSTLDFIFNFLLNGDNCVRLGLGLNLKNDNTHLAYIYWNIFNVVLDGSLQVHLLFFMISIGKNSCST